MRSTPERSLTEAMGYPRRNQPDAEEASSSYICEGMVIIEHLSARTGDIIRT